MDPDSGLRAFYLILLGGFLFVMFIRSGRALGRLIRGLIVWGLVIGGVAAGYTVFVEEMRTPTAAVSVEGGTIILARGRDNHFRAEVEVNGRPIPFIIDTGATEVVLSHDDARTAGIDTTSLTYLGRARTANGTVRTAPVRLDTLSLGDRVDTNVRATVSEGDMGISLLGMSYLSRFSRIEIVGGEMRLIP